MVSRFAEFLTHNVSTLECMLAVICLNISLSDVESFVYVLRA